ncbi:hypothetical protein GGQ88_003621 [Novosphingobium hassiacum]|uniref:Uncharacterized protein n=1 Tax=Novosphingobium hassiacum TaxID=173676 RepID=A0A7W6EXI2_9SPHN|nr:hypothetical protein [Novosphingobium hassiacum]MBB3862321.1 hypothetical protein [Novosphingobium hassiacum]
MSYDHTEIGNFASEKDAQDWAERNNLDLRDLSYGRRTGFF